MAKSNLQEREQPDLEQRRKEILKVVRRMIFKSGTCEITMRKVADESSFSNTVVYAPFGDKPTMITIAIDDDLIRPHKLMRAAVAAGASALERIRLACHAYVENGLRHPDPYFLVVFPSSAQTEGGAACSWAGSSPEVRCVSSAERMLERRS